MRLVPIAVVMSYLLLSGGCGESVVGVDADATTDAAVGENDDLAQPGDLRLTIAGSGYAAYEGATVTYRVVDLATIAFVGEGSMQVSQGGFSTVTSVPLQLGHGYGVTLFVDFNQDGLCSPASGDLSGDVFLSAVTGPVTAQLDLAQAMVADAKACQPFPHAGPHAATVHVTGLSSTVGTLVVAALAQTSPALITATRSALVPTSGHVDLEFPAILDAKKAYQLVAYLDSSGDGQCQATEPAWQVMLPPPPRTADVVVDLVAPAPAGPGAQCTLLGGPFSATISLDGVPAANMSGVVQAAVTLTAKSGFGSLQQSGFLVNAGTGTVRMEQALVLGVAYDYCVCLQGSGGTCGTAPDRPSWSGTLPPGTADATVALHFSDGKTSGCNNGF